MKKGNIVWLFLYAGGGSFAGCLAVVVSTFTIYPGLRVILFGNILVFCLAMGGPALIGGLLVGRFSKKFLSVILGFGGIVLGVLWHIHLSFLSAHVANASHFGSGSLTSVSRLEGFFLTRWLINMEYAALIYGGFLTGLIMLLLPAFLGILGTYIGNMVIKSTRVIETRKQPRGIFDFLKGRKPEITNIFDLISADDDMLLPNQVQSLSQMIRQVDTEILYIQDTSDQLLPECTLFVPNLLGKFQENPNLAMIHGLGISHAWIDVKKLREIMEENQAIRNYRDLFCSFTNRGYDIRKIKYIRFRSSLNSTDL